MTRSTNPPKFGTFERLGETVDLMVAKDSSPRSDTMIKTATLDTAIDLAQNLYGTSFRHFVVFIMAAGMSKNEVSFFQPYVFGQLANMELLRDPKALAKTLALVLDNFYVDSADAQKIIGRLEEEYNIYISMLELDLPPSKMASTAELSELIEKILATEKK